MSNPSFTPHVLRIDVRHRTFKRDDVPDSWMRLGGRGLLARILLDEIPATSEPLGPFNKLIFAPGLLVGHMLTSCDRISIGAKSPLTRGVKESNAGGTTGYQLACLGIKALIIEGLPKSDALSILYISPETARFDPGEDLRGKGIYESAKILNERYGKKVAIALIGPGGEQRLAAAGICNLDIDQVPSRIAGRGGMGAVMGSKGIKAIIFDTKAVKRPPLAHPEAFREAQKVFTQAVIAHPQTNVYKEFGTSANSLVINALGALPTRNFSKGNFDQVENISGELMREQIMARGGDCKPSHACMPGCVIQSSNIYGDESGKTIVAPLEYETIGLVGSNLEIGNLDTIARIGWNLNDIGLDSIDIGAALGVAAQAGVFDFGDGAAVLRLLDEIRAGTPLGRILGNGAAITGRVFGITQVPVVKGQAMSAYDPRAIKGTGVTYATSPQGADHTCGLTFRAKVNHLDPAGQADLSRTSQINMAGYDTLGACTFSAFGISTVPHIIRDLLNARYDWQVSDKILQELGRETLTLEREFNKRAGFTAADDRIPEYMTTEPLSPNNTVFDVPEKDLDGIFNW